jgi:flagellar motor switch protein FliN
VSQGTVTTIDRSGDSEPARAATAPLGPAADSRPFDWLPRLSARQVRLERWLSRWSRDGRLPVFLDWVDEGIGGAVVVERPEILERASGLNRPGLIAQLTAPLQAMRLAIGIENALAHALVDRLLGFDRPMAESRLQLTPVEWGVWTFLILRALDSLAVHLAASPARDPAEHPLLGPGGLRVDRVGPDPFDPAGLGAVLTVRWSVRVGTTDGAARLWIPESLVRSWLDAPLAPAGDSPHRGTDSLPVRDHGLPGRATGRGDLSSQWRAETGWVALPQGLRRLRVGGILPLIDSLLTGTPASPGGTVDLVLDLHEQDGRSRIPTTPVPDTGGRLLRVESGPIHEPWPRDPILVNVKGSATMSPPSPPSPAPEVTPLDVPVTLAVELGRVNLTLTRLADLKPGDVIELSRHSRAPVELTSNGRLVARGELILIDTDLGVRVTSVFL